jgi:hypothetical protein
VRANSVVTPRDALIERLVALTEVGASLNELEKAELRMCRYLASLSPDAAEFVRILNEQSESAFVPPVARAAAQEILTRWNALGRPRRRRPLAG